MRTRSVAVSALLVCWLFAGAVAFSTPAAAATIEVDHTLGQTSDDRTVDVETEVQIPDGITSFEMTIPEGTDVYESEGFTQTGERTYEWTRSTNEPYLRYDMVGDDTIDRGNGEGHLYAVTDEWAIVRSPSPNLEWRGLQSDVDVSVHADGEGVAGRHITYLGPYEESNREAAGQRFRFVEPDAADLHEDRGDVLDAFEYTAERLDVGQRDAEVLVVVAPTENVEWAATGVQRGDADMWVRDAERLDDPKNTWVHEYVHTLQDYDRTEETRWTIEGMADYYAALLTYERGDVDYETFRDRMEDGSDDDLSDVRLVDPATWESNRGNYDKGGLVFGYLDRRLRAEADTSIDAVVADVNDPDEELTHEGFLDAIEAAGGSDLRSDAERYVETTAAPPVWSREEHVAAFGGPDFRYEFDGFTASGPYREATLDEPRVVAGETLEATVRVRNVGTQEGAFDAAFRVDGDAVGRGTGTLAPDETTTLSFEHAFETAGEYDLAVGNAETTAVVEEPAGVEVTGIEADPADAALGEQVTLRATVDATADRPAAGDVAFTVDGETVATESVRMAGGSTTVEATTTFDAPDEYSVAAGGQSATVTVRDATVVPSTATPIEDRGGTTPTLADGTGLGPAVAVVALAAAGLLLGRRD